MKKKRCDESKKGEREENKNKNRGWNIKDGRGFDFL